MTTQPSLFRRLVGLLTGTPAPTPAPDTVRTQLDRLTADFNGKVDRLTDGLLNNTVTVGQYDGALRSMIRQQHLAAAVVSAGGSESATPQTYALAQRQVDSQMVYFDAWMKELFQQSAAGELPSAEYLKNRAKLYAKAAGETASRGTTQARGLPVLPFYPKQATKCQVGCLCRWDIRVQDAVNGSYDCYWTLGSAEHCPTCLARSRAANPLRVRRGQVQNPDRYTASNLYA